MNMDQAAVFLAGSILLGLGCISLVASAVAINNLLSKYWKPIKIFTQDSWKAFNPPSEFSSQEELKRIAPHLKEDVDKHITKG